MLDSAVDGSGGPVPGTAAATLQGGWPSALTACLEGSLDAVPEGASAVEAQELGRGTAGPLDGSALELEGGF